MDEIALRYLLLGLRLGRHIPGFVSSYHGPGELAEAVDGEPLTPAAELHDEAMQLTGMAADLPADSPRQRNRVRWLAAQLKAMGALARRVGGEEIGLLDLVEELYDIEVQPEPEATFETARRMIETALPGRHSLRARLADHDQRGRVPADRVVATVSDWAARLRARTRSQLWLPEPESVTVVAERGMAADADARYLGVGRSRLRVNLDRPVTHVAVVELAARETYPGHHAEACVKEATLVANGQAEVALIVGTSPQALMRDGMASLAREVVMSDQELGIELQNVARSVGGRLEVEAELTILRARRLLGAALANAAVALHRDGESTSQIRAYLAEVALVDDERLDSTLANLADAMRSTELIMATEGRRLVSEWLEHHGQTQGYGRLMAEQLTPASLDAELY